MKRIGTWGASGEQADDAAPTVPFGFYGPEAGLPPVFPVAGSWCEGAQELQCQPCAPAAAPGTDN